MSTLTSDRLRGDLIVAGCGDGYVRAYDRRMPFKEAYVVVQVAPPSHPSATETVRVVCAYVGVWIGWSWHSRTIRAGSSALVGSGSATARS